MDKELTEDLKTLKGVYKGEWESPANLYTKEELKRTLLDKSYCTRFQFLWVP